MLEIVLTVFENILQKYPATVRYFFYWDIFLAGIFTEQTYKYGIFLCVLSQ